MEKYSEFTNALNRHLELQNHMSKKAWTKTAFHYVNGVATSELRRLIEIDKRRASGAFFTEHVLAKKVLKLHKFKVGKNPVFYDPCCGAGNLLLATQEVYSRELKQRQTSFEILGTDIHADFVEAAKVRISINTILYSPWPHSPISNIETANSLQSNSFYEKATHIITNPPFNLVESTSDVSWSSGKVSAAALFIDRIIRYVKPGTLVLAILPEVLRCGARYEKWRRMVENQCEIKSHKELGQFDKYADVDVFSILLKKREAPIQRNTYKWVRPVVSKKTIADLFNVCVGPVVDNRDPQSGVKRPYIKSRGLPGWSEIKQYQNYRKFSGKSFESPLVVVKRTSRQGEVGRAIGTIINLSVPVYVDNHLIVLIPKSGLLKDCSDLLDVLNSVETNEWIDSQIRCRHLTVKVVSNIPI